MTKHNVGSVALLLSLFAAACAPTNPKIGSTEITSSAVLGSYRESEAAADDLANARWTDALARAERASLLAPENAYAHYDRAVALRQLGRTDAAVAAFREAEARFGSAADRHGSAISIYGRARALDDVGRCDEARTAYEEFARFTSSFDPAGARMARTYAVECRPGEAAAIDVSMSDLVTDVISHDYVAALDASEHVGKTARGSGWVDYNRAIALAGLGRTDDAIAAYHAAEMRFATAEPHGRAVALYGRARVLDQAGRCSEARTAYAAYADLVRATSPNDAAMAERAARTCGR